MSFTARVKDELSRLEGRCDACSYAELSAIVRVCGTLTLSGRARHSIRVSTETGAVARTMIRLTHELFDLETPLTVRRSNLHKARNYLIEIPEQDKLAAALVRLGIVTPDAGLVGGVPEGLLVRRCCKEAFVRGAFMAGGFIADPRGDFHLEIAVTGDELARGIRALLAELGVEARLNRRRGAPVLYLKSFEDISRLLCLMGARRSARAIESVRRMKSLKNDVNRRVNAELANQARSTGAALRQLQLIDEADRLIGVRRLPPALEEFCVMRRRHPDVSFAQLGKLFVPPVSKSALYHRVLRLQGVVEESAARRSRAGAGKAQLAPGFRPSRDGTGS